MGALFIDLAVFGMNLYFAIAERGTILGWLATCIVLFYIWMFTKAIREI
jgi:hypothetical protein